MADYKEKFDDLHRAARRKAREIDEKLGVKGIVEDTARVAGDAAKLGAKTIAEGAEQLRAEAGRFAQRPRGIGGILPEGGHAPWTVRRGPWLALSHSEARAPG